MKALTLVGHYLPGYKSGGPLRTLANMVHQLEDEVDFWIITRDRDAVDTEPYPGVEVDAWNQVGKAQVLYASSRSLRLGALCSIIDSVEPDVIYLNSSFLTLNIRCLLLRKAWKLRGIPVILAPRGEFSPGALALKRVKKRLFITLAQKLGLYDDVLWQASSEMEREHIRSVFHDATVHIAPDMPSSVIPEAPGGHIKRPGEVSMVFLSRISPKKNLHGLLKILGSLSGSIHLTIIGPVRDPNYWKLCQRQISALPRHIKVEVLGGFPHEEVHPLLGHHDFFALPTLGESFGHAILEAMTAGTPVIISDQTPWRNLADKGAGWDLPLSDRGQWQATLQHCVDMNQEAYDQLSNSTRTFAVGWLSDNRILEANRRLFERAVSR